MAVSFNMSNVFDVNCKMSNGQYNTNKTLNNSLYWHLFESKISFKHTTIFAVFDVNYHDLFDEINTQKAADFFQLFRSNMDWYSSTKSDVFA